jgi:hypothetical protein
MRMLTRGVEDSVAAFSNTALSLAPDPEAKPFPEYRGLEWVGGILPTQLEPWPRPGKGRLRVVDGDEGVEATRSQTRRYLETKPWVWPSQVLYFFCDVHADTDAFLRSLVASGGVAKTGPHDADLELTPEGRGARFLIGGDCFDKGPENLRLLRALRTLIDTGAQVDILAGNHDIRTLLGMQCAGSKDPRLSHLFVRMGQKTVPLFREVWNHYLRSSMRESELLPEERVRELLFPPESWYDEFPRVAAGRVPPKKLAKELARIREKTAQFEGRCHELGMSLGMVHAALLKSRELFTETSGEFRWFFERMGLAHRAGSFLFLHAGVDDTIAGRVRSEGVGALEESFRDLLRSDPFELYHGSVGNCFRTKYRDIDHPFTGKGLRDLNAIGIYAVVHGHRNVLRGQRMVFRRGLLNFECDSSLDCNTRASENLSGPGGAVTVFRPDGVVLGISTDHPNIKVFDPAELCGLTTIV